MSTTNGTPLAGPADGQRDGPGPGMSGERPHVSAVAITPELSRRLTAVSFFSACCIVLLHAYQSGFASAPPVTAWLTALTRCMVDFSVPLFFAVSGFLLAVKTDLGRKTGWYPETLRKRVRTLLVPYLAWCALYGGQGLLARTAGAVRSCAQSGQWGLREIFPWLSRDGLLALPGPLAHVFGLDLTECPQAIVMWFVRALMIFVLLSPLLLPMVRRKATACLLLALTLAAYFAHGWLPESARPFFEFGFSLRGLFFFCAGMACAVDRPCLSRAGSPRGWSWTLAALWLVLSVAGAWGLLHAGHSAASAVTLKFASIAGAAAVWCLPRLCPAFSRMGDWSVSKDSFFLYALHYDLMEVLLGASVQAKLQQSLHVPALGIYLLRFLIPLALSLIAAELVKRLLPRLYGMLTGGR